MYDTIILDTCHHIFLKPVRFPRGNPNVNDGLWVIMMCEYRFINCHKCTTPMGNTDYGRGCACVGAEGIWEISIPASQFYCEPKLL